MLVQVQVLSPALKPKVILVLRNISIGPLFASS